jgi:hypothetical protein
VNGDCPSALYPNCDPTPGQCLPPCAGDGDCPAEFWKCDIGTGLCFLPECTQDSECNPPTMVCENWFCVPGCTTHADCAATHRCDLVDPGNLYHCEPRDCFTDADCSPPTTVCDTDGLVDPDGGGYCEPGCQTYYDCRQLGYDCNPALGTCSPKSYGDIGQPCGSCASGFCLTGMGNVCTDFCCVQHDCPADWGCQPVDDGTGSNHTVDVCIPLPVTQGDGRYMDPCGIHDQCRSGVCYAGFCRESCCTDADCNQPFSPNMYCGLAGGANTTACLPEPATGNDPLGTLGCATTGTPSDCRSNMCFTNFWPDTACVTDADCPATYPTCWDYPAFGQPPNGINDCVHDMCIDNCCSVDDCPPSGGDIYFCGKWVFSPGDVNVCLYHLGTATVAEGQPCASNGECISNFCSPAGMCRRRCCTDADCVNPLYPDCRLESLTVYGNPRELNVCQ